jgi:hypothetical protein
MCSWNWFLCLVESGLVFSYLASFRIWPACLPQGAGQLLGCCMTSRIICNHSTGRVEYLACSVIVIDACLRKVSFPAAYVRLETAIPVKESVPSSKRPTVSVSV